MRSLDECRSEIFRLGENKIKERRKRRNAMLLACVPVCLCIVAAVTFMPYDKIVSGTGGTQSTTVINDGLHCDIPITYLKVEIQGYGEVSNVYNQVIKADKINHIAELIEVYYSKYDNLNGTGNPMFDYGGDKGENGTLPENGAMPDMAPSGYIISFKTATDYTVEYTLSGHILKNNTTNKTVFLSQSERTQLLFELTHTD